MTKEAAQRKDTGQRLTKLLIPDIVLPEQFFRGDRGRNSVVNAERALMLAVLEDGIRCFQEHLQSPRSDPRRLAKEAEQWIQVIDYDWLFSFVNVCETLGINPSALRSALLAWKARRLADREHDGAPTPTSKKVYRLHLRTKRTSGIGQNGRP